MAKSLRRSPNRHYDILVASVEGVADRFRSQYTDAERKFANGELVKDVQDALDKLTPDADPEAVTKIIGNKSWTHPYCDCCRNYAPRAAEIGEGGDSARICAECLEYISQELSRAR